MQTLFYKVGKESAIGGKLAEGLRLPFLRTEVEPETWKVVGFHSRIRSPTLGC